MDEEKPVFERAQRDADDGYLGEVICRAAPEQVFAAVATINGLRGWWTPIVAGVVEIGERLAFGFEGIDEAIVMRVDELTLPVRVRWTCLIHTGAPDWAGTSISFRFGSDGEGGTVLALQHYGLPAHGVAAGWDRFLASLTRLVETAHGDPYRVEQTEALKIARSYHGAWTTGDFAGARRHLAADLETEVPINSYDRQDDFAAAVASFGGLAERVDLLAEFGAGQEALLLYDMHLPGIGPIRVAEHFTVEGALIRRIRHVHDTAPLQRAT